MYVSMRYYHPSSDQNWQKKFAKTCARLTTYCYDLKIRLLTLISRYCWWFPSFPSCCCLFSSNNHAVVYFRQISMLLKALEHPHMVQVEIHRTHPHIYVLNDVRWHTIRGKLIRYIGLVTMSKGMTKMLEYDTITSFYT